MSSDALQTLFLPLTQGGIASSTASACVLFLGAQAHGDLTLLARENLTCWQIFKPYAQALEAQGYQIYTDLEHICAPQNYDLVLILMPKNKIEAEYWLAQGLSALKSGGTIICAAANDAGGKRLDKMLRAFGVTETQNLSKNKARVVWGQAPEIGTSSVQSALQDGAVQDILGGFYRSQPGIFGWDKMDKGTELLIRHLTDQFFGRGADFGCGYGALSRAVLERASENLKSFTCLDADARAVALCARNAADERVHSAWCDLTQGAAGLKNLDFIVMNPPFHEGKASDSDIGLAFIRRAHETLKPRGILWIVANAQLPYERVLGELFSSVEKLYEGGGFKLYRAMK